MSDGPNNGSTASSAPGLKQDPKTGRFLPGNRSGGYPEGRVSWITNLEKAAKIAGYGNDRNEAAQWVIRKIFDLAHQNYWQAIQYLADRLFGPIPKDVPDTAVQVNVGTQGPTLPQGDDLREYMERLVEVMQERADETLPKQDKP